MVPHIARSQVPSDRVDLNLNETAPLIANQKQIIITEFKQINA